MTSAIAGAAVAALALLLIAPGRLTEDVTLGLAWTPLIGARAWSRPLALLALVLGALALARAVRRARLGDLLPNLDLAGSALLALGLAAVVLAFAGADPERAAVSGPGTGLLIGSAATMLAFTVRERRAARPLLPRGTLAERPAWGALLVNLLVGVALVAALVDVPLFARATSQPTQLGPALVLVRLLVAVPIGALAGGWLLRRVSPPALTAVGLLLAGAGLGLMTRWSAGTLVGPGGSLELIAAGLGFGLAIAPVNAAMLAATDAAEHGVASALLVAARMIGMLAGVSVLTAIGLRAFYSAVGRIGSPIELCPTSPASCPAYDHATRAALLTELHTIFAGGAGCAVLAAALGLLVLRRSPPRQRGSAFNAETRPTPVRR